MKIKEITSEQEAQIHAYIKKWVCQASKPMDEPKAIDLVKKMYERMQEKMPIVIIGNSPLSSAFMAAIFWTLVREEKNKIRFSSQLHSQLRSQLFSQLYNQLDSQLRSQLDSQLVSHLDSQLGSQLRSQLNNQLDGQLDGHLGSQLRSQLYNQLDSQLGSQLESQLDSQLRSQLHSQLHSQLDSQLLSQLLSQLDSQLGIQLGSQLHSQLHSQLDSQLLSQLDIINYDWYLSIYWLTWCGWYEYGKMLGVKFDEPSYEMFINFNSEISFIIPYKGICFISRKPTEIHWKGSLLHCESSGAVKYADGYSMYMLNGVRMTAEQVMTPAEKINIEDVVKEQNIEVRRELIRKIGIERFIQKSGAKVLDKKGYYELLSIRLSDEVPDARYLKMLNPSIGVWHVEGVDSECDTVEKAINWRSGDIKEKWEPAILT